MQKNILKVSNGSSESVKDIFLTLKEAKLTLKALHIANNYLVIYLNLI